MSNLTPIEQETIILYNKGEPLAVCMTYDPRLIRKLDGLCGKFEGITLVRDDGECKEYTFPKGWVKVSSPRKMSEEQRERLSENMKRLRQSQLEGENADDEMA